MKYILNGAVIIVAISLMSSCALLKNSGERTEEVQNAEVTFKDVLSKVNWKVEGLDTASLSTTVSLFAAKVDDLNKEYQVPLRAKADQEVDFGDLTKEASQIKKSAIRELEKNYQDKILKLTSDPKYKKEENRKLLNEEIEKNNDDLAKGISELEKNANQDDRLNYYAYRVRTFRLFPAKSLVFAKMYNNDQLNSPASWLNNSSLIFGEDLSAFTSNIVSGYPFIPVKFSVNTVVAKGRLKEIDNGELIGKTQTEIQDIVNTVTNENLKNNTLAHLVNGGGFLSVKAEYPILNINGSKKNKIKFDVSTIAAYSGEFSKGGSSVPSTEANTFRYLGSDCRLIIPFIDINQNDEGFETFSAFVGASIKWIDGSPTFFQNLNQVNNEQFYQFDFTAGIIVGPIKISYNKVHFSKPTLNEMYSSRFTIGYVPKIF